MVLWAEVKKETGRWKSRWRIRDLLADRRCSRAMLGFLASAGVGEIVPTVVEEDDAGSEASEWERRERRERGEVREAGVEALGDAGELGPGRNRHCSHRPRRSWRRRRRDRGRVRFLFPLSSPLCLPCFVFTFTGAGLGGGQKGACNEPPGAECRQ